MARQNPAATLPTASSALAPTERTDTSHHSALRWTPSAPGFAVWAPSAHDSLSNKSPTFFPSRQLPRSEWSHSLEPAQTSALHSPPPIGSPPSPLPTPQYKTISLPSSGSGSAGGRTTPDTAIPQMAPLPPPPPPHQSHQPQQRFYQQEQHEQRSHDQQRQQLSPYHAPAYPTPPSSTAPLPPALLSTDSAPRTELGLHVPSAFAARAPSSPYLSPSFGPNPLPSVGSSSRSTHTASGGDAVGPGPVARDSGGIGANPPNLQTSQSTSASYPKQPRPTLSSQWANPSSSSAALPSGYGPTRTPQPPRSKQAAHVATQVALSALSIDDDDLYPPAGQGAHMGTSPDAWTPSVYQHTTTSNAVPAESALKGHGNQGNLTDTDISHRRHDEYGTHDDTNRTLGGEGDYDYGLMPGGRYGPNGEERARRKGRARMSQEKRRRLARRREREREAAQAAFGEQQPAHTATVNGGSGAASATGSSNASYASTQGRLSRPSSLGVLPNLGQGASKLPPHPGSNWAQAGTAGLGESLPDPYHGMPTFGTNTLGLDATHLGLEPVSSRAVSLPHASGVEAGSAGFSSGPFANPRAMQATDHSPTHLSAPIQGGGSALGLTGTGHLATSQQYHSHLHPYSLGTANQGLNGQHGHGSRTVSNSSHPSYGQRAPVPSSSGLNQPAYHGPAPPRSAPAHVTTFSLPSAPAPTPHQNVSGERVIGQTPPSVQTPLPGPSRSTSFGASVGGSREGGINAAPRGQWSAGRPSSWVGSSAAGPGGLGGGNSTSIAGPPSLTQTGTQSSVHRFPPTPHSACLSLPNPVEWRHGSLNNPSHPSLTKGFHHPLSLSQPLLPKEAPRSISSPSATAAAAAAVMADTGYKPLPALYARAQDGTAQSGNTDVEQVASQPYNISYRNHGGRQGRSCHDRAPSPLPSPHPHPPVASFGATLGGGVARHPTRPTLPGQRPSTPLSHSSSHHSLSASASASATGNIPDSALGGPMRGAHGRNGVFYGEHDHALGQAMAAGYAAGLAAAQASSRGQAVKSPWL